MYGFLSLYACVNQFSGKTNRQEGSTEKRKVSLIEKKKKDRLHFTKGVLKSYHVILKRAHPEYRMLSSYIC